MRCPGFFECLVYGDERENGGRFSGLKNRQAALLFCNRAPCYVENTTITSMPNASRPEPLKIRMLRDGAYCDL